jgi:hypothetical protein
LSFERKLVAPILQMGTHGRNERSVNRQSEAHTMGTMRGRAPCAVRPPGRDIKAFAMKVSRKPTVPEPSTRAVIWIVATALVLLCAIVVFDYATGDPRASWAGPRTSSPAKVPPAIGSKVS